MRATLRPTKRRVLPRDPSAGTLAESGVTRSIRRGENGGRTLEEANVVRSVRSIGAWEGSALHLSEKLPEGEDVAVLVEAPDGRIVGSSEAVRGENKFPA